MREDELVNDDVASVKFQWLIFDGALKIAKILKCNSPTPFMRLVVD